MPSNSGQRPLPFIRVRGIGAKAWRRADRRIESIRSMADLETVQAELRERFDRMLGPRPDTRAVVPFTEGQAFNETLGYIRLAPQVVERTMAALDSIR